MDFNEIKGYEHCKRGLEVALAGNHGVLLIGVDNPAIPHLEVATHTINSLLLIRHITPCACGNFTHPKKECRCRPYQIQEHITKETARLPMDNIFIHLEVPFMNTEKLDKKRCGEPSSVIVARIQEAQRFPITDTIDKEGEELLKLAILELGISCHAYDKVIAVASTKARLDGKGIIEAHHISEAISYRSLDRNLWG